MKVLLIPAACILLLTGCGAASDVSNLVTSTPATAALAVAETNAQDGSTAMAAYFAETGSYAGATTQSCGRCTRAEPTVTVVATGDAYCVQSIVDGVTASVRGPGSAAPGPGAC